MLFPLLLLTVMVALVYALAAVLLIRLVVRRFSKKTETKHTPRALQWFVFALSIVGLACIAWGFLVEPFWPEVTQATVTSTALPEGADPIRIVQLSDTHSDTEARLEPSIPERVARLDPDVIIFTGDALNEGGGLHHFQEMMAELAQIAPTFAVYGNWDVWFWEDLDLYGETGVHLLDGESSRVDIDGREIWIAGAAVGDEVGLSAALEGLPSDRLSIFVHHYPERVTLAADRGVDLVLAGDTHGGQLRLPFIGPVVEMSRFGDYYDMGLHRVGNTWLYVHRGVGMEGGHAPRARFMCRPEIAVIEIVNGDG